MTLLKHIISSLVVLLATTLTASSILGAEEETRVAYRVLDFNDLTRTKVLTEQSESAYVNGYEKVDGTFVCDARQNATQTFGFVKSYRLDQEVATPLLATGWSKGENVGGNKDSNYSLYLDIIYNDGTALWGQVYEFPVGDSDWNQGKVLIMPDKPIQSLSFYGMFRYHTGKVAFKDLELRQYEFNERVSYFDGTPILTKKEQRSEPNVYVRDVAKNGNFLEFPKTNDDEFLFNELDVALRRDTRIHNQVREEVLSVSNKSENDRALVVVYALPFPEIEGATQWRWWDAPRASRELVGNDYSTTKRLANVGAGRLSQYPFGVVSAQDEQGNCLAAFGLGIDPNYPACFRIAANANTRELYIAFDVALTRESPRAEFHLVPLFWTTASDGLSAQPSLDAVTSNIAFGSNPFRACFDLYRQIFSEAFTVRALEQGNWMAFAKISKVPNYQDFGFQFKEGIDETEKDDDAGITTFRYTEPMTWWQQVQKSETAPKSKDAAYNTAKITAIENQKDENGSPRYGVAEARALLTTGFRDKDGRPYGLELDTPWCDGVVWSMNDAPGLVELARQNKLRNSDNAEVEPIAGFEVKWNDEIANKFYGEPLDSDKLPKTREEFLQAQSTRGCDGEYVDSSEGYVTATLDFNRAHFSGMKTPLVYDTETYKPAIFRGLIAFEYVQKISEDCRRRGKLTMANSTPHSHFWLAPQLDVLGTETNWNHSGGWRPMPDDELMYRRVLCCGKPYCFLMNTDFSNFSKEATERYMKRALAYGMFPSFFSADASTAHYFETPELYERDRDLFKKYLPIVKETAEAGWEPETGALVVPNDLVLERYGSLENAVVSSNPLRANRDVFLTLYNDSQEKKEYRLVLGAELLKQIEKENCKIVEELSGREIKVSDGTIAGELNPGDVSVFKIAP